MRTRLFFVSANFKMSFDRLREALASGNAWLLVLDTDGNKRLVRGRKGDFRDRRTGRKNPRRADWPAWVRHRSLSSHSWGFGHLGA